MSSIVRVHLPDLGDATKAIEVTSSMTTTALIDAMIQKLIASETINPVDSSKFSLYNIQGATETVLKPDLKVQSVVKKWDKKQDCKLVMKSVSDKLEVFTRNATELLAHTTQKPSPLLATIHPSSTFSASAPLLSSFTQKSAEDDIKLASVTSLISSSSPNLIKMQSNSIANSLSTSSPLLIKKEMIVDMSPSIEPATSILVSNLDMLEDDEPLASTSEFQIQTLSPKTTPVQTPTPTALPKPQTTMNSHAAITNSASMSQPALANTRTIAAAPITATTTTIPSPLANTTTTSAQPTTKLSAQDVLSQFETASPSLTSSRAVLQFLQALGV